MKRYTLYSSALDDSDKYGVVPSQAILADVNGKKLRMIVDTGSDSTFLVPAGFQKLGIGPEGIKIDGLCAGIGGHTEAYGIHQNFTVNSKTIPRMGVFMQDFGENDGLIGMDVLAQFKRVTFDLEHKQLILED